MKTKTKTKFRKSNVEHQDEQLIEIYKNKIQIWQQAEDRAKQYLMVARKRRKQAERELKMLIY